ncbi:MAG: UDP-N-acetylmuramate dehydrogenase [Candidatus Pacebacteria bacterium]|nr:UDP-N-acetylmuramate dehydrogenase [Candidatus Paceibacterota bacterium]
MIETNKNLKDLNTFMVPAVARYFASATNNDSLYRILASNEWSESEKHFVLGGGSNILFINDYDGFVLKNEISGIDIVSEDNDSITVRVGAGVSWHDFVMWSVKHNYWGIENLAYIPGTVGAAPVQNIGAYGVEAASVISSVEYVLLPDAEKKVLFNNECNFDYRNSIFKKNPEKYIITYVYITLQKKGKAMLNYGRVAESLTEKGIKNPTPQDIATIIIDIRKSKLPKVGEVGMAGSFFKNPIISKKQLSEIQEKFPQVKYFDLENDMVKIPAGWILDELGYRGFTSGNVGNYKNHALIVTHNGNGTGVEVYKHVKNIIKKVHEVFSIDLEPEVNIVI